MKTRIKTLLLSVLFYFILIDSGGPLGVRNISLAILVLLAISNFFTKKFSKKILILNLLLLFVFFLTLFFATIRLIEIPVFIAHSLYLIMTVLFSFSFLSFSEEELVNGLLYAGNLFLSSIYLVFLVYLVEIPFLSSAVKDILINFPGWFYLRSFMGIPFVQIYFQATLTLVPIGLIALFKGRKKSFILYIITLFICFSRFGVITLLFIYFLIKMFQTRKLSGFVSKYFLLFTFIVISFYSIYYLTIKNFEFSYASSVVRIGHLKSIFDNMSFTDLLIGEGTGSVFYSIGSAKYVDNTELTQLSFLRKNGILAYLIFHFYINLVFVKLHNIKRYELTLIVFAFFFVSLSNPVLTSLTFSILLGMSTRIIKYKLNQTEECNFE